MSWTFCSSLRTPSTVTFSFFLFSSALLFSFKSPASQPNTSAPPLFSPSLSFTLLSPAKLFSHSSCLLLQTPTLLSLSDFFCSCLPPSSSSSSTALLCSPPHAPPQLQSKPPQQLLSPPWVPPPFWVDLQTLRNRNTSQCVCVRACVWVHSVPTGQTGSDCLKGKLVVYS